MFRFFLFCLFGVVGHFHRLVRNAPFWSSESLLSLFDHLLHHSFLDFENFIFELYSLFIRQLAQVFWLARRNERLLATDSSRCLRVLQVPRSAHFRLVHAGFEACARGHLGAIQIAEVNLNLLFAFFSIQLNKFSTLLRKESAVFLVLHFLRAVMLLLFFLIFLRQGLCCKVLQLLE